MNPALLPNLQTLIPLLPLEGAICLDLWDGIPRFRASQSLLDRIQNLLETQQERPLTPEEEQELDRYEEIDDYLSFVNRTVRNTILAIPHQAA
jgi:uncharacterized protein YnzC (UPF0291/DUF896 family)